MEITKLLLPIVGNIGWVIGIVILYKTGVLSMLLKKNGKEESIMNELEDLKSNHLHEITDGLKRIEDGQNRNYEKLVEIAEGIVHIKARINGK